MRNYITKSNLGGTPDSITPTKLGAGETNSFLTELATAVTKSGQTPAIADGTSEAFDQLSKAMAIYGAGGAGYCIDTGSAGAYVLDPVSPKQPVPALFDGLTLMFTPGNTNPGASTINYNSIGAISVKKIGGFDLTGGELLVTTPTTVRYNLTGGYFEIISPLLFTSDQTFTVGSGGDFADMTTALVFLSKFRPIYTATGVTVTLNMLAGFELAEQIISDGINLGWIRITGTDAVTDIDSSLFTISFDGPKPAFAAINGGTSPSLEQSFQFTGSPAADIYGIMAISAGSVVNYGSGNDLKNAGGTGIYALNGGRVNAPGVDLSNSGSHGVYATDSSCVNIPGAVINTTGASGIYATNCSQINAEGIAISSTTGNGVTCQKTSSINVRDGSIVNVGISGIDTYDTSRTNAHGVTITGAGTTGTSTYEASIINLQGATISGSAGHGINLITGGTANANGATYGTSNVTPNTLTGNGILFV